jgi:hypothetical protein
LLPVTRLAAQITAVFCSRWSIATVWKLILTTSGRVFRIRALNSSSPDCLHLASAFNSTFQGRVTYMNRTCTRILVAISVVVSALFTLSGTMNVGKVDAKSSQAPTRTATIPLPASDGMLYVELRRLIFEGAPRAFNDDPQRLADLNANIDNFKTRTGIDARQVETLAVGARIAKPRPSVTKLDHVVAIANGKFDANAVMAASRSAAGTRLAVQKHRGKNIHVITINDQLRLFGILKMNVGELAITSIDATTIAVGDPVAVRAALDAQAGRGAIDPALVAAARQPGALISFAGNIAANVFADIETGLPDVDKSLASIRRIRGTLGMTDTGIQLLTVLGTENGANAQRLTGTIEAVRQVAPALLGAAGERGRLAQGAIKNLQVTTRGNDVELRLDLAQNELAAIMRAL